MRRPSLFFVLLAVAIVATVEVKDRFHAASETVAAADLRIIDGDTVALGRERIRLLAIDAPETWRPHCYAEYVAGERAKADLERIVAGKRVTIARSGHLDRYGRTLARLLVDNKDVGAIEMADGVALAYKPGFYEHRERIAHWCGPGNW